LVEEKIVEVENNTEVNAIFNIRDKISKLIPTGQFRKVSSARGSSDLSYTAVLNTTNNKEV